MVGDGVILGVGVLVGMGVLVGAGVGVSVGGSGLGVTVGVLNMPEQAVVDNSMLTISTKNKKREVFFIVGFSINAIIIPSMAANRV